MTESIPMVDLRNQYLKIKPEIDQAISEVVESAAFINGPAVRTFAENLAKYLGVKHVIPCANGTDALQIALMSLDLQPGDEVITPSFTYIATTEVVALLRLTPVFVDVDPDTFVMDPKKLEASITSKTKAIVPVHLYGQMANMKEILAIANKHKLFVIEDVAQAIGSDFIHDDATLQKAGTIGHIGCTSFFPSKNLGCFGDGGAIFTNYDDLAEKLRKIANHGQEKRYYHDLVGCNSRLDSIQAAVLNVKLKYLDRYNMARQAAADRYDRLFANHPSITTPKRSGYSSHVFHQYTLKLEGVDSDKLIQKMAEEGIPAMIYYPVPGHEQKMFEKIPFDAGDLSVTDYLTTRVISLPMHTELTQEIQERISSILLKSIIE